MKKNSVKFAERAASLVVCLALVLGIVSPLSILASGDSRDDMDKNRDGVVDVVVIGSYDAAGFGISGYDIEKFGYGTAPDGSYADALKKKIEATGKQVNLTQLGIGGMRAEEVRYLLDSSYSGDKYTEENFLGDSGIFAALGGAAALREQYAKALKKAEVITLDIGFDNFASYALAYIFENKYEANLSIFDESIQRSVGEIKGRFEDVIAGYVADSGNTQLGDFLNRAVNGLVYALSGYCHNFDEALKRIYKLNSQATIVVCDVRNPLIGLDATMDGIAFTLPLEQIYSVIVEMANIYMASLSECKDMYYYAYLGSSGMALDEIKAYSGNPESISPDLVARLDASLGAEALSLSKEQLLSKQDIMMKLLREALSEKGKTIDFSAGTAENDIFGNAGAIVNYAKDNFNKLIQDSRAMTHLAVAARYSLGAISLLDRAGHAEMAEKIYSAISEERTGDDALNDMSGIFSLITDRIDRDTILDIEYSFKPHYICDNDSYYVALGDGSAAGADSYPQKLAQKLISSCGLSSGAYKNYSNQNKINVDETPYDTLAALKSGGAILESVKKADLITLSYTNLEVTRALLNNSSDEINWSELLGEEFAGTVDEIVREAKKALVDFGLESMIVDAVIPLAERYAYAYLKRAIGYVELAEYIHEINPDALVVIVGTYNEFGGIEIVFNNMALPFGRILQYLIDAANLETLAYALITENTAYIAAPDVETIYEKNHDTQSAIEIPNVYRLTEMLKNVVAEGLPSNKGYLDVANAVLNPEFFTAVGEHSCEYDNDCDDRCNICMARREAHTYTAECDAFCNLCGAFRFIKSHTYSAICVDTCSICGEARTAAEHTYSSDCDTECNLCKETRESSASHSFGDWTDKNGERVRKCEKCGYTEQGDGDSGGIIIAVSAIGVVAIGVGGFAIFWFVIKKKSLADLLAVFAKK